MAITQTVEITDSYRLTLDVPREVPKGRTIITFTPAPETPLHPCPICAKNIDPLTGNPRYNAETIAGMQEVEDMLTGKIPNTLKKFNSLAEMLEDLERDDPDENN